MSPHLVLEKLSNRLNKSNSGAYANVEELAMIEAINKAQLEWVRKQLRGTNLTKDQGEESNTRVDDLQVLLNTKPLSVSSSDLFCQTDVLPSNYGWFNGVLIYAKNNICTEQLILDVHHIEESNVNNWISDEYKKPDFEFRQCFYTLANNRVKVYTNNEFKIEKVLLTYYRKPSEFQVEGVELLDKSLGVNKPLEFKDDVVELIIDEAVTIIAADIEHTMAYNLASSRKNENN
jgi:hypothetical protein